VISAWPLRHVVRRETDQANPGCDLTPEQRAQTRWFGRRRANVEHVFRVIKCQSAHRRIEKNSAQVFTLLALANLYLIRGRLVSA
jgi:IS5 family transposase